MDAVKNNENNSDQKEQLQCEQLNQSIELNEEQKQFIAECEAKFVNRYTDDDLDYVNNKIKRDSCKKELPLMDNWWSRQSMRHDRSKFKRRNDNEFRYYRGFKRSRGRSRFD